METSVGKTQVRPSSPRQFFARLYGHLEDNANKNQNNNINNGNNLNVNNISCNNNDENIENIRHNSTPINISGNALASGTPQSDLLNYQSDGGGGGSASSPDISISDERCVFCDSVCNSCRFCLFLILFRVFKLKNQTMETLAIHILH